jgi:hypothetical protein
MEAGKSSYAVALFCELILCQNNLVYLYLITDSVLNLNFYALPLCQLISTQNICSGLSANH